jgi:two-component system, NarL family, sensor histidine kinase UhpB
VVFPKRQKKAKSVVETTEKLAAIAHNKTSALQADKFDSPTLRPTQNFERGYHSMPDRENHYGAGLASHLSQMGVKVAPHKGLPKEPRIIARLSLPQKLLLANLLIVGGSAIVGSFLTSQLTEAGQFNGVTFAVIIICAVMLSGSMSFWILQRAFRPFMELQRVLDKIHTGNPRARAALTRITDPDVRHFTIALNQMLNRLEDNAKIIQEDQHQLQLMTARVLNAQENERKRIARELHDEASQALTAMIMGLESAKNSTPDPALQTKLSGLKDLAGTTLEELRKLALDLRPTMLDDLGLVPAMQWLMRTASERGTFETALDLENFDSANRLPSELETCLFRITQESLNNVVKHAKAHQVRISLENLAKDKAVRLTICDDGKGFDRAAARASAYSGGHLGLFDIEERATLLGGKLELDTGIHGTTIVVTVPASGLPAEPPPAINTHARPYTL